MLSVGSLLAVAQAPKTVSELQIGYVHETFHLRDLQASLMRYVANLNGIRLAYGRRTTKHQWRFGVQAGYADLIAPKLGIREIKFSPEQEQPLYLVPTLYRGNLELEYRRLVRQRVNQKTWLGVGLHDAFGYADGLALTTWTMNAATLNVLYQTRFQLGRKSAVDLNASLPVLAAVSRMPYSNVVSRPNSSDVATFFSGTKLATVNQFLHPQLGIGYCFEVSDRLALRGDYRYSWMRYPEPRTIRTVVHTASLSMIYKFQRQIR